MTYFSTWPPWAARLVLALVAVLIILGAVLKPVPQLAHHGIPMSTDTMLYRAIVGRMERGQDYYQAAGAEQRARIYPTAPPQVFRQPTLAWLLVQMKSKSVRRGAIVLLSVLTFVALREGLAATALSPPLRIVAVLLLVTALVTAWGVEAPYVHEFWAGLLIASSLALNRLGYWRSSVAAGIAACLVRELALPFVLVMALFALREQRYRELAAWILGALLFSAAFACHLSLAAGLYRPGDRISPGWLYLGGWPLVLETAKRNLALLYAPNGLVAAVVCLALIGWAGFRDRMMSRAALILGGYMAAFLFVGRPNTPYWGILYAPLLPIGVALSPMAVRDLIARARTPQPVLSADGAQ